MCKKCQEPVLKIGTTVHVGDWAGDWAGTVEYISKDKVVLILQNGRRMAIDHKVIEDAIGKT